MAATGLVSAHSKTFSGVRPVLLRHDLSAIADLIETCFAPTLDAGGRSAIQEMRFLSRAGPLVWLLGHLDPGGPLGMRGFVWIEQGRLVGNVSLSPADENKGWVISNVAVYPDYRRRGIARRLMQAALEFVAAKGTFATLQVEADNTPARALYEDLGFELERTFTRWRRNTYLPDPDRPAESLSLRRLQRNDVDALYALAQEIRPDTRGGMGWQRPTRRDAFKPARLATLRQLFTGRRVDTWVLDGQEQGLDAALIVEARMGCATALFDLLVHSEQQGQLEARLLQHTIRRLDGRFRPLVTQHPADDAFMEAALRQHHFRPERTLAHMIWHP
jgi:ribosomal protein S18 acetylase RimI-like enzyme